MTKHVYGLFRMRYEHTHTKSFNPQAAPTFRGRNYAPFYEITSYELYKYYYQERA